jgi:ubiquinone biosynthesis protein
VAAVLIRYGFGELVSRLPAPLRRGTATAAVDPTLGIGERLRRSFESLGPTFMKLGQFLAGRPLAIPPFVAVALSRLEDSVPPVPFEQIAQVLEREWRDAPRPLPEMQHVPFAAASLAEAFDARLPDGRRVVVKVQRPNIEQTIRTDLEILTDLAAWAERNLPELAPFQPSRTVAQLTYALRRELDFTREARHIELFRNNFRDSQTVLLPDVAWAYTTNRVLTATRVDGIKISDVEALRSAGYDLREIVRLGSQALFEQIFVHGFYHADPHPGNIFVAPGPKIAFVDFGLVGYLTGTAKRHLADVVGAAVARDPKRIVRALEEVESLPPEADTLALEHDLNEFMYRYHQVPLNKLSVGGVLTDLYWIVERHQVRLRPELMLLLKTLSQYDRIARLLDPEYDLVESIKPFGRKLLASDWDLESLRRDALQAGSELRPWLTELPYGLRQLLRQVRRGGLSLRFTSNMMESLTEELDRASNRVSFALLVAGLVVGSALLLRLEVGWKLFGLSVFGLAGLVFAGFLGVSLLIGILRSGRL